MERDPRPRLRLRHLAHERSAEGGERSSPLTVRRPATGYTSATAVCGWCGAELRLRVAAARKVRQSLQGWALVYFAGVLAVVGGMAALSASVVWLAVVLMVGGLLVAVVGAAFWWWATGVRPVSALPDGKPGPHVVRPDRGQR
ncbi:hypothetical protein [Amycolatopsis sp. NPDC051372]|uniref:hypothetical protein n=1 Tax=unclassified Amycolatopsis TaxID=2618356 RepID=UPI003440E4F8